MMTSLDSASFAKAKVRQDYDPPRLKQRGRLIVDDPFESRLLDVIGSLVLLIAFAPMILLICLAIFVVDPGPVFFAQLRIGKNGKKFKCYKFRTMVVDAEERLQHVLDNDPAAASEWARDHKLRDDPRIAGIGRFLRKSSLDELPQLWNVLRGDMSLVGPRPIVSGELARYGKYIIHYMAVRPGLTGLWQISGRNDVSYRRRVAYDVIYARSGRTKDNVRILVLTVPSVIASRGSY